MNWRKSSTLRRRRCLLLLDFLEGVLTFWRWISTCPFVNSTGRITGILLRGYAQFDNFALPHRKVFVRFVSGKDSTEFNIFPKTEREKPKKWPNEIIFAKHFCFYAAKQIVVEFFPRKNQIFIFFLFKNIPLTVCVAKRASENPPLSAKPFSGKLVFLSA